MGKLTGWMFTDAVAQVGCPKCGAVAGQSCCTPKGRKADPPHQERCKALTDKVGIEPYRHNIS